MQWLLIFLFTATLGVATPEGVCSPDNGDSCGTPKSVLDWRTPDTQKGAAKAAKKDRPPLKKKQEKKDVPPTTP